MNQVPTKIANKLTKSRTAVLVVDMQNGFCDDRETWKKDINKSMIRAMIPRLQAFLTDARNKGVSVIFIRSVMQDKDFSVPIRELCLRHYGREVRYCLEGAWETEFIPELEPRPGEITIAKTRYSGFYRTELDATLSNQGITSVIITGVGTNVCVETTAREAYMRDYLVVVPGDLVACTDAHLHEVSLQNLDRYFATVTTSYEILRSWNTSN